MTESVIDANDVAESESVCAYETAYDCATVADADRVISKKNRT